MYVCMYVCIKEHVGVGGTTTNFSIPHQGSLLEIMKTSNFERRLMLETSNNPVLKTSFNVFT